MPNFYWDRTEVQPGWTDVRCPIVSAWLSEASPFSLFQRDLSLDNQSDDWVCGLSTGNGGEKVVHGSGGMIPLRAAQ